MGTGTQTWSEEVVELGGAKISATKGGNGDPLLILHDEMGYQGWRQYHEQLAKNRTLYIPSHPGYGASDRLDWIMTVRDLAGWYLRAVDDMGIAPVDVIGIGLGGWLAAEMAAMCPQLFKRMVISGAPGIRPTQGEIFDMFLATARDYIAVSVKDPAKVPEFPEILPEDPSPELREAWEVAREESCRLTWKPYMFDPALPHLLARLEQLPTLIIWGDEDNVVPVSTGQAYHQAIKDSHLALLKDCGHRPEFEKTREFVKLIEDHLSG